MVKALERRLTRWDLVALIINTVMGAGALGLPARFYADLGRYSVIAWILCGVIMGLVALSFAEVSSHFTATGGVYLYAYSTLGPWAGFIVGWLAWVSRLFSVATVGNLAIAYAMQFEPRLAVPWIRALAVTAVYALIAWPLLTSIRRSAWVNSLLTVIKLAVFGSIALTLFWFDGSVNPQSNSIPQAADWQSTLLQMSFALIGIESAMVSAGEMRDPTRDAPVAILIGLLIVALLYVAVQWACIGIVPNLAMSQWPVTEAASRAFGGSVGNAVAMGGLLCMLGTLYAVTFTASRLSFAQAEQDQLPRVLARIHPRFQTPTVAVGLTISLAWLLTLATSYLGALAVTATTRLVGYVTTCAALMVLRHRNAPGGIRIRGGRGIAIIAAAACLWLISGTSHWQWLTIAAVSATGLLLHMSWRVVRVKVKSA